MIERLPWLLLVGPSSVSLIAAAVYWASSRVLNLDDRVMVDGRRSIGFGLVAILVLVGGIAEWVLSAELAIITPGIVASYPNELARWIYRVFAFSLAAGVFVGLGAYGVCAWWHGPRKARSISHDGKQ